MPGMLHKFVMARLNGAACPFDGRLFKKDHKAPDVDPRIGEAAIRQAKLGEDYLAWEKERYEQSKPRQARMDALTEQTTQADLATRAANDRRASEQWDRYKTIFAPIEDEYAAEARQAGGVADQADEAGRAAADVEAANSAALAQHDRAMMASGVNPASGKFDASRRMSATMGAAAKAGAMTGARVAAKDRGLGLKANVSNMGRGLSADTSTGYGLGLQAGSQAMANGMAGNNYFASRGAGMATGTQAAMQGQGALSNTYGQIYNAEAGAAAGTAQAKAGQKSAAIGAVAMIAVAI